MEKHRLLLEKLITKKTGYLKSSLEFKDKLKNAKLMMDNFHGLEVDPKYNETQIEELCEKLYIHSLDFKSVALKRLYKAILQFCDKSQDFDHYLLINGIVLFLLEINGPMVNSYDYEEPIETNEIVINEEINWSEILTKSEDIVSLTQNDFQSDDSSEYSLSDAEEIGEKSKEKNDDDEETEENKTLINQNSNKIDYNLIKSKDWDMIQLTKECSINLQSEYWSDNVDRKYLSSKLMRNRNSPLLIDQLEHFFRQSRKGLVRHAKESNRIELSEYQLVRETIDILTGSTSSVIFRLESDSKSIGKNRFVSSQSVKLVNLSWHTVDAVLKRLAEIASHRLRLRLVSTFVCNHRSDYKSMVMSDLSVIVAFCDRLHAILVSFAEVLVLWERRARSANPTDLFCGDTKSSPGLSLFSLLSFLDSFEAPWANRLRFFDELVTCVSVGRFEALLCASSEITLLNLLYKSINEACLIGPIDRWIDKSMVDLFQHSLQPYLHSLDSLLSGQTHKSINNTPSNNQHNSRITFLHRLSITERKSNSKTNQMNIDIVDYWTNRLSLVNNHRNTGDNSRLLNDIPVLLHPFVVQLISTIKSIDLLHLLSIELSRPSIIDPIIIEPGGFINHFNHPSSIDNHNNNHKSTADQYRPTSILDRISHELQLKTVVTDNKIDSNNNKSIDDDENCSIESINRNLHRNLLKNVLDRYRAVNSHLISVYIHQLDLRRALHSLLSIHLHQSGAEMSDFTEFLFDQYIDIDQSMSRINLNNTDANINIDFHQHNRFALELNLKLHQILTESFDRDLQIDSNRFSVRVSSSTSGECLPKITIEYRLDWWLRLILTDEIRSISDRCFQFLLELRFAKHRLETRLRTGRICHSTSVARPIRSAPSSHRKLDHDRSDRSICVVRLCALRLKLRQIINNLHSYIANSFIAPSIATLNSIIDRPQQHCEDFGEFIDRINEPFRVMVRGCLQTRELETVGKAVRQILVVGLEAARIDIAQKFDRMVLIRLEEKYAQLVDFIASMLRRLEHLGVSLGELDLAAFK